MRPLLLVQESMDVELRKPARHTIQHNVRYLCNCEKYLVVVGSRGAGGAVVGTRQRQTVEAAGDHATWLAGGNVHNYLTLSDRPLKQGVAKPRGTR